MIPHKNFVSEKQLENCHKLIRYALSGNLKAKFNMGLFAESTNICFNIDIKTDCGTVGCFAGHGPYAGIEKLKTEGWYQYTKRQFGVDNSYFSNGAWKWVFAPRWVHIDNTPEGAAGRLLYLLEYGLPEN